MEEGVLTDPLARTVQSQRIRFQGLRDLETVPDQA